MFISVFEPAFESLVESEYDQPTGELLIIYIHIFNSFSSDSCHPWTSRPHPGGRPVVLPHEGKEEVLTTPTCARQPPSCLL